jgi:hypothetical protein
MDAEVLVTTRLKARGPLAYLSADYAKLPLFAPVDMKRIDLSVVDHPANEGLRRRDEGIGTVDLAEGAIWKSKADAAIRFLIDSGEEFGADDVRRIAGDPRHPNAMGGRLLAASRKGLIVCVGRRQSTRAECHAHANPLWRAA